MKISEVLIVKINLNFYTSLCFHMKLLAVSKITF